MWQTISILAEAVLHLICLVGLITAIGIVLFWCISAYIMYQWMHQQSGHGLVLRSKQIESEVFSKGLSPGSKSKSENVVKKTGVM